MSAGPQVEALVRVSERLALCLRAGLPWTDAVSESGLERLQPPRGARRGGAWGGYLAVQVAVEVVRRLGAPAAEVLDRAARGARDVTAADRSRAAAVAGPAASARIVGALPLAGPVVAGLLGVDALAVLLGSGWGRACGVLGLLLLGLSWWWSRHLVARAVRLAGGGREGVDEAVLCDLAAAALGAGVPPAVALLELAEALERVEAADAAGTAVELRRCAVGMDSGDLRLVVVRPRLAPLLDALAFAVRTGCPAAPALLLAGEQLRRDQEADAALATARLAAHLVLPLGLAALPGFLLLGVAPVVVQLLLADLG